MTSPIKTENHTHLIWGDEGEEIWMTDAEYQADQAALNEIASGNDEYLARKDAEYEKKVQGEKESEEKIKQAWARSKNAPLASNVITSEDGGLSLYEEHQARLRDRK